MLKDGNPQRLYAVDPSKAMLDVFQQRNNITGINIIQGSIDDLIKADLPAPDKIISHGVLVTIEDRIDFLRKVFSCLQPDGKYFFSVEDWNITVNGQPAQEFNIDLADAVYAQTRYKLPVVIEPSPKTVLKETIEREIALAGGKILRYTLREKKSRPVEEAHDYCLLIDDRELPINKIEEISKVVTKYCRGRIFVRMRQHVFETERKS